MRILVTGGAGFIASHIADAYLKAGHQVAIVDNFYHGFKRNVPAKAKLYRTDITQPKALRNVFQQFKPQVINHHAALSTVVGSMRDPLATFTSNVMGTGQLLELAREFKTKQFIFASTGGTIYGNAKQLPTPETAPLAPISAYAASKQLGEQLIQYFARVYGIDATIFRYGNVFGVRQDPKGEAGVVAIFAELLNAGKQVTIFGDGSKTRDYIYINDVVQANVLALKHRASGIYNLGLGKGISDQQVFATVAEHFPNVLQPKYKAVRAGEVQHTYLKSNLARTQLGWKPQWSFADGVADYLQRMGYAQ